MGEVLSVVPKRGRGRPPLTPAEKEARRLAKTKPVIQDAPPPAPVAAQAIPTPVEQVRHAFTAGSRLSAIVGLVLGGFVPLATYTVIRVEVAQRPQLWLLVAGGLIYSAISVYTWARMAFKYWAKALGFVVLLESTLALSRVGWLSLAGLAILMLLNGASAAVVLQQKETEDQ